MAARIPEGEGVKVSITVTVDVDPAGWAAEYGCERSEVRQDVRRYVVDAVTQLPGVVVCAASG